MRKNIKMLVFIQMSLTFLTWTLTATAASKQEFACQEKVRVKQNVKGVPDRWSSWNFADSTDFKLTNVQIFEGHPGGGKELAPKASSEHTLAWTFLPFGKGREKPIWILCRYEHPSVVLGRSIPNSLQNCELKTMKDAGDKKFGPIICK